MDQIDIVKQIKKNITRGNSVDVLKQIDAVLDSLNVYAYKNWIEGEIVDGPHIERYWVTVTLMYDYKQMPDPEGALRITNNGGKVYYGQDVLVSAATLRSPDDVDMGGDPRRPQASTAKKVKRKIWLVTIEIPRQFMDSFSLDRLQTDDIEVDNDKIEQAYDEGLNNVTET